MQLPGLKIQKYIGLPFYYFVGSANKLWPAIYVFSPAISKIWPAVWPLAKSHIVHASDIARNGLIASIFHIWNY
jgi:hypothetical protein